MFMETEQSDGSGKAAAFLAGVMDRFGLGDRWCYHALHENGQHFGLSKAQLQALFDSAELIINLHGGTEPLPEHAATGRLIYIQTDPVQLEIELHKNQQSAAHRFASRSLVRRRPVLLQPRIYAHRADDRDFHHVDSGFDRHPKL